MRQGCKIIDLGESTAIMCGGEPSDHVCNENAVVYETSDKKVFFEDIKEAGIWYDNNYKSVKSGSVACSICHRAAIDNAMWL